MFLKQIFTHFDCCKFFELFLKPFFNIEIIELRANIAEISIKLKLALVYHYYYYYVNHKYFL